MKKKLLAILLCLAMVVSMLPSLAFAETAEVKYMTWDDTQKKLVEKSCTNYTLVTGSDTEWKDDTTTDGWYVVDGPITISNTVTCAGAIHLILKDGANLTVTGGDDKAGICVSGEGNSLTIYGQSEQTGTLKATGGNYGAGIGGGDSGNGSDITINGGSVTAEGRQGGAGIGGGSGGAGSNITINGGNVKATGKNGGAGIGGGITKAGSSITINGGIVTANGGNYSAGIGGGYNGAGSNITINGGSVTATGGNWGAGIGGGQMGAGSNITINGGSVTATGGYEEGCGGAGIGSGFNGNASNNIKVEVDIVVKTSDDNTNWTEISHNSTSDLFADFAGKTYVKTEDPSQHTIFLQEGKAYLDTDEGTDVTGIVASKGLKYVAEVPANVEEGTAAVPAHWEMNNFNFTTTAATAVEFADDGEEGNPLAINITVKGTNTIKGGDSVEAGEILIGMDFSGYYTDVTITGSGENPVLNVEAGNMNHDVVISFGLDASNANLTISKLAANFSVGKSKTGALTGTYCASCKKLTVENDAIVTITASKCNEICMFGLQVSKKIIVSGNGKLIVSCEELTDEEIKNIYAYIAIVSSEQPCAKAVITPKSVSDPVIEPDWDDDNGVFMNGETYATDVTLTSPIEVGTQSATLTYGTEGSATYSVTKYPTAHEYTNYKILWKNADGAYVTDAPTGVTAILDNFTEGVATLTVSNAKTTPAGSYSFIVTANDGEDVIASIPATLTVGQKSISNCTVEEIAEQTYVGEALTPTVTVKDGDTTLKKDTDYTVEYSNNSGAGTATVTIKGIGNYTGEVTQQFTIVSRCSVKITKVNPNPAQHLDEITVTATAVVPEGYELVWSLDGNAKGEIVETSKDGETAKATVLAESSGDLEITAEVVDSSTGKAEVSDTAKVKVEAKYNNIIQRLMKIFKKVFVNIKILLGK